MKRRDVVLKDLPLGSWQLPSGNLVMGHFLHSKELAGFHMEIEEKHPLSAADLHAYAGFIFPVAQDVATSMLKKQKGKRKGGRA